MKFTKVLLFLIILVMFSSLASALTFSTPATFTPAGGSDISNQNINVNFAYDGLTTGSDSTCSYQIDSGLFTSIGTVAENVVTDLTITTGSWSEATHNLIFRCMENGNSSNYINSASQTFTKDVTNPTVTITSTETPTITDYYTSNSYSIQATINDANGYTCYAYRNGTQVGGACSLASCTWGTNFPESDTLNYPIVVNCTDDAGNVGSDSTNLRVDNKNPIITIDEPDGGWPTFYKDLDINYGINSDEPVTCQGTLNYEKDTQNDGFKIFAPAATRHNGMIDITNTNNQTLTINTTCTDLAGNEVTDIINLVVDNVRPIKPILYPFNSSTYGEDIFVIGYINEPYINISGHAIQYFDDPQPTYTQQTSFLETYEEYCNIKQYAPKNSTTILLEDCSDKDLVGNYINITNQELYGFEKYNITSITPSGVDVHVTLNKPLVEDVYPSDVVRISDQPYPQGWFVLLIENIVAGLNNIFIYATDDAGWNSEAATFNTTLHSIQLDLQIAPNPTNIGELINFTINLTNVSNGYSPINNVNCSIDFKDGTQQTIKQTVNGIVNYTHVYISAENFNVTAWCGADTPNVTKQVTIVQNGQTLAPPVKPVIWPINENHFTNLLSIYGYINEDLVSMRSDLVYYQNGDLVTHNYNVRSGYNTTLTDTCVLYENVTIGEDNLTIEFGCDVNVGDNLWLPFQNIEYYRYFNVTNVIEGAGVYYVTLNEPVRVNVTKGNFVKLYDHQYPAGWFNISLQIPASNKYILRVAGKNHIGYSPIYEQIITFYNDKITLTANQTPALKNGQLTFTLNLTNSTMGPIANENCTIYFGDGTNKTNTTNGFGIIDFNHTYSNLGTYLINATCENIITSDPSISLDVLEPTNDLKDPIFWNFPTFTKSKVISLIGFVEKLLNGNVTIRGQINQEPLFNYNISVQTGNVSKSYANTTVTSTIKYVNHTWIKIPHTESSKFVIGDYVEFSNHNKTLFTRYKITDLGSTMTYDFMNISPGVEIDIPANTKIMAYKAINRTGYFNLSLDLFPGNNEIYIWSQNDLFQRSSYSIYSVYYDSLVNISWNLFKSVFSTNLSLLPNVNSVDYFKLVVENQLEITYKNQSAIDIEHYNFDKYFDFFYPHKLNINGEKLPSLINKTLNVSFTNLTYTNEPLLKINGNFSTNFTYNNSMLNYSLVVDNLTTSYILKNAYLNPSTTYAPDVNNNSQHILNISPNYIMRFNNTPIDNYNCSVNINSKSEIFTINVSENLLTLTGSKTISWRFNESQKLKGIYEPLIFVDSNNSTISIGQNKLIGTTNITVNEIFIDEFNSKTNSRIYVTIHNKFDNVNFSTNINSNNMSIADSFTINVTDYVTYPILLSCVAQNFELANIMYDKTTFQTPQISNVNPATGSTNNAFTLSFNATDNEGINLATLNLFVTNNTGLNLNYNYTSFLCAGTQYNAVCSIDLILNNSVYDFEITVDNVDNQTISKLFQFEVNNQSISEIVITYPTWETIEGSWHEKWINASWNRSSDSGILTYHYGISESSGKSADVSGWKNISDSSCAGSSCVVNITNLNLIDNKLYYVNVYVENAAGNQSIAISSPPILFRDVTPPIVWINNSKVYSNDKNNINFNWYTYDNESGINRVNYEIKINGILKSSGTLSALLNQIIPIDNLTAYNGQNYTITIISFNNAITSDYKTINSTPVTLDLEGPTGLALSQPSIITNNQFTVNVSSGSDAISGLNHTEIWVKKATLDSNDGSCLTYAGWTKYNNIITTNSNFNISPDNGVCYQYQIKVYDVAGNLEIYSSGQETKVDFTKPGNVTISNDPYTLTYDLDATWTASAEAESGVNYYTYSIGSLTNKTEYFGPFNTTNTGFVMILNNSVPLTQGVNYYFYVSATNRFGITGDTVRSVNPTQYDERTPPNMSVLKIDKETIKVIISNKEYYVDTNNTNGFSRVELTSDENLTACKYSKENVGFDLAAHTCSVNNALENYYCVVPNNNTGYFTYNFYCKDMNNNHNDVGDPLIVDWIIRPAPKITVNSPVGTQTDLVNFNFTVESQDVQTVSYTLTYENATSIISNAYHINDGLTKRDIIFNTNTTNYLYNMSEYINLTISATDSIGLEKIVKMSYLVNNLILPPISVNIISISSTNQIREPGKLNTLCANVISTGNITSINTTIVNSTGSTIPLNQTNFTQYTNFDSPQNLCTNMTMPAVGEYTFVLNITNNETESSVMNHTFIVANKLNTTLNLISSENITFMLENKYHSISTQIANDSNIHIVEMFNTTYNMSISILGKILIEAQNYNDENLSFKFKPYIANISNLNYQIHDKVAIELNGNNLTNIKVGFNMSYYGTTSSNLEVSKFVYDFNNNSVDFVTEEKLTGSVVSDYFKVDVTSFSMFILSTYIPPVQYNPSSGGSSSSSRGGGSSGFYPTTTPVVESNESCYDGILNQNEDRIDCGGVCAVCKTTNNIDSTNTSEVDNKDNQNNNIQQKPIIEQPNVEDPIEEENRFFAGTTTYFVIAGFIIATLLATFILSRRHYGHHVSDNYEQNGRHETHKDEFKFATNIDYTKDNQNYEDVDSKYEQSAFELAAKDIHNELSKPQKSFKDIFNDVVNQPEARPQTLSSKKGPFQELFDSIINKEEKPTPNPEQIKSTNNSKLEIIDKPEKSETSKIEKVLNQNKIIKEKTNDISKVIVPKKKILNNVEMTQYDMKTIRNHINILKEKGYDNLKIKKTLLGMDYDLEKINYLTSIQSMTKNEIEDEPFLNSKSLNEKVQDGKSSIEEIEKAQITNNIKEIKTEEPLRINTYDYKLMENYITHYKQKGYDDEKIKLVLMGMNFKIRQVEFMLSKINK